MNQIKSIKIKDNLYVNTMAVVIPKEVELKVSEEPVHQFLIFDRSGSMSGYLNDVMEAAKDYCSKLPDGSVVSLGYFSGTNEYSLSVPYTLKKEVGGVTSTLDSYKRSISMTNFIQILQKVNETASKMKDKASLFFFTDGCHNSGGSPKAVLEALKEWGQYAAVSMFVGCGWIDRQMMQDMATTVDGTFIHLNKFSNFKATLEDFGTAVEDSTPSVKVDLSFLKEDVCPVAITGKAVTEYMVEADKSISFRPSKKEYKGFFFTTTSKVEGSEEVTELNVSMEKGVRALALSYSQKNNTPAALDLLSYIGDKYLIQSLYNSITADECAESETKIRRSVFSPKDRNLEGVVKNFLPADDCFCVLDAVNILAADPDAKMYVRDPDFEYERIGKKQERQDGPGIEYEDDLAVGFNNIVMNKERLNLSISTSCVGQVPLDPSQFKEKPFTIEDREALGLPEKFRVTSFRTYTIIADGKLQTQKLVMSDLSKDTINKLGTIITRRKDGRYVVDFSILPIINKQYVKLTSARVLAENVWEEKLISDQISVLNYFKKKTEEAIGKPTFKTDLSEEAALFLYEQCYIKNGSYSPPMKTVSGDDEYEAYSFDIEINGYSKATAKAVIEKVDANKTPTPREAIVAEAYGRYKTAGIESKPLGEKLKSINESLLMLNQQLSPVRKFIQLSKFAIILGNKGSMDEFKSRDNMVLPVDVISLDLKPLKVQFDFKIEKVKVKL